MSPTDLRRMKSLFLAAAISACSILSCAQQTADRLEPAAFKAKLDMGNAQLVDVRTPEEYADSHLEGAVNIDWLAEDFAAKTASLDKSKPVLVYCAFGGRSEEALNTMKQAGFTDVHDLIGGIKAWKKSGEPVTTK
jgi:rhodanese-related sulfurtransferase